MVCAARVVRSLILCGLAVTTLAFAKTGKTTERSRVDASKTVVTYPSAFAVSQRVSELPIDGFLIGNQYMHEPGPGPMREKAPFNPTQQQDPALQTEALPLVSATIGVDFDGIPSPGYVPSDTNIAVGPKDIVQTVNVQFAVYSKTGALLSGPTNIINIFTPLGGDCAANTFGDPIILYDRQADRWLLTMIGSGSTISECIAISKTNDPAGAYFLYSYSFGQDLNDYDKLSVWPTASNGAYLATYNIFGPVNFLGADLCGYDRTKMLAGNATAAQLCKMTPNSEFGYLPSDNDGPTPPVDATPGLFITWQSNNPGQLFLRTLTLNFAGNTATLSSPTTINVANDNLACGNGGTCVPQPGTSQKLDTLGDRLMYRFPVRHFADHDRAVLNHAVANGSSVGIRWYELFDPAGSVTLNQQGTFAPDATFRWMGSIAEDQNANIGLGYSVSSTSINPSIRFTGRVPSDPLGTLESEATLLVGTGSQTPSPQAGNRWGDYTAMVVDPSDDCTFWYVNQYEKVNGVFNWSTNIGSFIFNACAGGSPSFSLTANPNTLSIAQGSSGTSTITVVPANGFNGSVNLSASGLPTGVTAGFNPSPTGTTSMLTLTASATATTGTSTVTVTGTSGTLTATTTLQLTVTQSGGGPVVTLVPTSQKWGRIVVGVTSPTKAVTLTNTGTATLNISSITISAGDFHLVTGARPCGATLAPGAFCKIRANFTPTQTGVRTGSITITDNAPDSPQVIPLTGTGK